MAVFFVLGVVGFKTLLKFLLLFLFFLNREMEVKLSERRGRKDLG